MTLYEKECATQTMRNLHTIFDRNEAPCKFTASRAITKSETTGLVLTVKSPGRKRSCRTEKQLVLVQDSVTVSPGKSIRRRLQQVHALTTSWHRILRRTFSIFVKCSPNKNSMRS